MKTRHYETLIVWKEAHNLCKKVYKLLPSFPAYERYCLCQQMRRSAYSVPMNIVEGNIKRSCKDKLHFIEHAEGSLEELDYQLLLSHELGYIPLNKLEELRNDINRVSYLMKQFRDGIIKNNQ